MYSSPRLVLKGNIPLREELLRELKGAKTMDPYARDMIFFFEFIRRRRRRKRRKDKEGEERSNEL